MMLHSRRRKVEKSLGKMKNSHVLLLISLVQSPPGNTYLKQPGKTNAPFMDLLVPP